MPESLGLPIFVGPIVAAVIGGGVAFIASVLSKEQKTSEFRQAWIDAIRTDLSEFVSLIVVMHDSLIVRERSGETTEQRVQFLFEHRRDFIQMEALSAKIKLRLNPEEHSNFIALIDLIQDIKNDTRKIGDKESDLVAKKIIYESQKLLKLEWRRVKRGEPTFIATKWISLLVATASLIYFLLFFFGKIQITFLGS